jgi:soluble lytic murein transglycosylase-like protein
VVCLTAVLFGVSATVPAVAQEPIPDDLDVIEAEQERVESDLGEAEAEIAAAATKVADAERQLRSIDQRLAAASAQLATVQQQASVARARADAEAERARQAVEAAAQAHDDADSAEAAVSAAAAEVVAARSDLLVALEEEQEALTQLADRAIGAYKHGPGHEQLELVGAVLGAGDWHDVGLAFGVLARVLDDDRELAGWAEQARTTAAAARIRAEAAEGAAQERLREAELALATAETAAAAAAEAAAEAQVQLAAAERAEATQAGALAAVQREQQQRQAIYGALEADAATAEVRRTRLEQRLTALDGAAREARRPPPPPQPPPPSDGGGSGSASSAGTSPQAAPAPTGWATRLPTVGQPWAPAIDIAARDNGLDPRLLAALVWTESYFNPNAVSWVGAIGLAQLMPTTATWLGVDPWVPEQNLDGGARYLAQQIARFDSVELGLAAYNAGPNAVIRFGYEIPPYPETQHYVPTVLERYAYLAG